MLVVEDDLDQATLLSDVLTQRGGQVWQLTSGAQVRAWLDDAQPDLIVMDLILPDADGLILLGWMRARTTAPVLICSGTVRQSERVLALKLGADDFLAKPFDADELEARAETLLRRAKGRRTDRAASGPNP